MHPFLPLIQGLCAFFRPLLAPVSEAPSLPASQFTVWIFSFSPRCLARGSTLSKLAACDLLSKGLLSASTDVIVGSSDDVVNLLFSDGFRCDRSGRSVPVTVPSIQLHGALRGRKSLLLSHSTYGLMRLMVQSGAATIAPKSRCNSAMLWSRFVWFWSSICQSCLAPAL